MCVSPARAPCRDDSEHLACVEPPCHQNTEPKNTRIERLTRETAHRLWKTTGTARGQCSPTVSRRLEGLRGRPSSSPPAAFPRRLREPDRAGPKNALQSGMSHSPSSKDRGSLAHGAPWWSVCELGSSSGTSRFRHSTSVMKILCHDGGRLHRGGEGRQCAPPVDTV